MARPALTGTRIRERRTALGVKQADLARAAGISAAYLNLIEHNRRRVSDALIERIAQAMGVDPVALSEGAEGALFDGLREAAAAAEVEGAAQFQAPDLDRIEEFVGRFPAWAALLASRQARLAALERVVETYAERMAQDPFLLTSLHEVLSAVTSLRSTAAILVETEDIEPEWRTRFLNTIQEESLRLSSTAEALVGYLDEMETAETGLSSPQEQLESWLEARAWHIPEIEEEGADPAALIAAAPELASSAARELARQHLIELAEEAQLLPLEPFSAALAELGPEPGALAARFGVGLGTVMRRLAALPPGTAGLGQPGLVICDGSGTLTFRRAAPGFALPRFAAACPLWPLYEALARPMQPIRALVDMAGRLPQRFLTYAICEPRPTGFDGPVLMRSTMLILPAPGGTSAAPARAVGASCRICPRAECPGRREPAIVSVA
ncbi:helix-turn-helix transcriptional regulator [Thioclava atlantica]|uniref:XRE family transcriptional regulator n=1 Tax=Thioclava atlantica TaxID=1317124 RepID=A0A085TYN1_9RHOB|nr:helix-turn-helix transcriptional regulator [Thioclava atlantica]KFE35828.1 XRE family transcriptional regulator [Thioclava atlantica]